jgi:two-component system, response regulator PdtaR
MSRNYLLIDDNQDFVENVAEILRDTGALVHIAQDGFTALELVRTRRFDAVVTDMRMPGMTGAELLHQLRELDRGVPVILLSAFSQDAQLEDARREGLLAVLNKPHQMPRLLALLANARRDAALVLVEDDPALSDNLSEALAARGLTVVTASSLREVDLLAVEPFAALVDVHLPGGQFGESIDRVQSRFPGTPTLVIAASGEETCGHLELFRKPFDTGALVERIEALYQEKSVQQ